MSEQGGSLFKELEDTGFLDQVGTLQSTLSKLSQDISTIGDHATQRLDEVESIAAHVMAIESVLAVILKSHPVDAEDLKAEVIERTRAFSDHPDGSPTVQAVAMDIIGA
jgi:archaellum component FlaC